MERKGQLELDKIFFGLQLHFLDDLTWNQMNPRAEAKHEGFYVVSLLLLLVKRFPRPSQVLLADWSTREPIPGETESFALFADTPLVRPVHDKLSLFHKTISRNNYEPLTQPLQILRSSTEGV